MSKKKNEQANPECAEEETAVCEETAAAGQAETESPALSPEEAKKLLSELEGLKRCQDESNDRYLRLCAEYDNFRKRTLKERESAYSDAVIDVVASFLPVYDNLERAMKTPTEDAAFLKGVEMTMRQFTQCLEKLGVSEIPSEGQPFDPNLHDAVMHVDDENLGENVVAEVFQKGFLLGDRIIRHAMVKVAN